MDKINYGLIHEDPRPEDYILGQEDILGGSAWQRLQLPVNGELDWKGCEPEDEVQRKGATETNACVSFSGNNLVEYLLIRLLHSDNILKNLLINLNLLQNDKPNFSDRRTAKGSGTDPNKGNSVRAVDDYIRNFLFCPEDLWPFPEGMSRDEYYMAMPAEVADYGKKVKPIFGIETKYLPTAPWNLYKLYSSPDQIWDGLQYSPVWVSVDSAYEVVDGIVQGSKDKQELDAGVRVYNHRLLVKGGIYKKFWWVHDSYLNQIRKFAWDYPWGGAKVMQIIKKKASPYIKVGTEIAFLGQSGKYQNEYVSFGEGDILKALFGEYNKVVPRESLLDWPDNYRGKRLTIK